MPKLTPELLQMACDVLAEMQPAGVGFEPYHALRRELEALQRRYPVEFAAVCESAMDVIDDDAEEVAEARGLTRHDVAPGRDCWPLSTLPADEEE